MTAPYGEAVRVRVPATSANLGPAFDCAGLALTRYDDIEFTVAASGLKIAISGEGAHSLPGDESHLVVRAFRAACAELGWTPRGLRLVADNGIPQGRGMGSSAAAVVAGVMAAWALCPDVDTIDQQAVLRLTSAMEGHPDNVAACLLGGLTLSWSGAGGVGANTLAVHEDVLPVVLVPEATLSTEAARGLLPDAVPHRDAAFNAGRSALLVHALAHEPGLLVPATEDRLHQRQRAAAMPRTLALIDRLRAAGHAAVVSGAGPSVLVLARRTPPPEMRPEAVPGGDSVPGGHAVPWEDAVPGGDAVPGERALPAEDARPVEAVRAVTELTPEGWVVLPLDVDRTGVRVGRPLRQVSSR